MSQQQQQQPPEGEAEPTTAPFDTASQVRAGPLLSLAIPQRMESGVAGVRLLVAHTTGHDDHVLDTGHARKLAEQILGAVEAAEEANRSRIETYAADALRDLGPPGNGQGGLRASGS